MSLGKKIKRTNTLKKKKAAEKKLNQKLNLFNKVPNKCLTCEDPFDKKNREQVFSWYVVVRQEEGKVNLYCPECWEKAIGIVKDFKERIEKK